MCCTLRPADLSKTILYSGEALNECSLVHVLGYQNRARNRAVGPNAMILPFPAATKMSRLNCLESKGLRWLMKSLADPIELPNLMRSRGFSKSALTLGSRSIEVFDSGEYTVVLAQDARDVPTALDKVPEAKRPPLNEEIFDAYAKWYPNWPIAVCCFETRHKEMEPDPLLWWFEPMDKKVLFAPALDAHNGSAPDLKSQVRVDHTVVFGSTRTPRGASVHFRGDVPSHVVPFIPGRVMGHEFRGSQQNGDFAIPLDRLTDVDEKATGSQVKVNRVLPPGAVRSGASTLELS